MKRTLIMSAIASFGLTLAGCASTATGPNGFGMSGTKLIENSNGGVDDRENAMDLVNLQELAKNTNAEIKSIFPKQAEPKIVLWATDLENLVDGAFTQTFGDKLSPSPSLKLHKVFKNTSVSLVDVAHVAPCEGMETGDAQYWVLRTYLSDLDEAVHRKVKGFYPNGESGSIQVELDKGTRSSTDTFKLSAKLTECRSGRIIHSAENVFSKTTSGKDKSFYLFGKHLGLFYRNTESYDPGLNKTKDLALDVFLSSIARDMVGVPQSYPVTKLASAS